MKPVVKKTILYTVTAVFVFFSIAYFCDKEWARLPWCILLVGISLYNLIWNRPSQRP
jgi:hypothetical protein